MDYLHLQATNLAVAGDSDLVAGTAGPVTLATVKDANHRIYIQKIIFSPTTYAAKTFTFQDTAGTPVPVGFMSIPATAPTTGGDVAFQIDFGVRGTPLTLGKSLSLVLSAAGCAGRVHVEGYQKQEGAVALP